MAQHFPRSPAGFRGTIDQPPTTLGKRTCKKCNTGHSGKKKSKPKLHVTMLSWYPLHIHLNYKMVGYQLDKKNHVRTKKWCFVSTISIIQTKNGWKTAIAKWISINLKLQKKQQSSCLTKKWYKFLWFPGGFLQIFGYQAWLWEETSQVPPTVTGHRRWHPAPHFQRPDGTYVFCYFAGLEGTPKNMWETWDLYGFMEICLIGSIFFPMFRLFSDIFAMFILFFRYGFSSSCF